MILKNCGKKHVFVPYYISLYKLWNEIDVIGSYKSQRDTAIFGFLGDVIASVNMPEVAFFNAKFIQKIKE